MGAKARDGETETRTDRQTDIKRQKKREKDSGWAGGGGVRVKFNPT